MLTRLRSTKALGVFALLMPFLFVPAVAHAASDERHTTSGLTGDDAQTGFGDIESMRSTDTLHGLYEIRDAARLFIDQENRKNATTIWRVLEPNRKILVSRCQTPLKAKWSIKTDGLSLPSVWVMCTQTIAGSIGGDTWRVAVPVQLDSKTGNKR